MGLDGRGDVAIVQLIVYAPILLISQFLLFRHGMRKQHGWLFLALFAAGEIQLFIRYTSGTDVRCGAGGWQMMKDEQILIRRALVHS